MMILRDQTLTDKIVGSQARPSCNYLQIRALSEVWPKFGRHRVQFSHRVDGVTFLLLTFESNADNLGE